jgi:hypothetical protein
MCRCANLECNNSNDDDDAVKMVGGLLRSLGPAPQCRHKTGGTLGWTYMQYGERVSAMQKVRWQSVASHLRLLGIYFTSEISIPLTNQEIGFSVVKSFGILSLGTSAIYPVLSFACNVLRWGLVAPPSFVIAELRTNARYGPAYKNPSGPVLATRNLPTFTPGPILHSQLPQIQTIILYCQIDLDRHTRRSSTR